MSTSDIDIPRVSEIIKLGGLVTGKSGNLSYRLSRDAYAVTVTGQDLRFLGDDSFVRKKLSDKQKGNASIEWRLHAFAYAASPSAKAVFHFQPRYLTALSILTRPPVDRLKGLLPETARYIKKIAVVDYALPGSIALARGVREAIHRRADALILRDHGAVVTGASVGDALHKAEAFEFAARVLCTL